MQSVAGKVTFRPLGRGRFKCVQTGIVLKRAQVGGYRRLRLAEMGFARKRTRQLLRVGLRSSGYLYCPHCDSRVGGYRPESGKKMCHGCKKQFILT